MFSPLLPYFILYIACLLGCYISGAVIRLLAGARIQLTSRDTFLTLLTGIFVIVTVCAIVVSHGATILLSGVVVAAFYFLYKQFNKGNIITTETINVAKPGTFIFLIQASILVLFCFLISLPFTIQFHGYPFIPAAGHDYTFYPRLAESLWLTGIENRYVTEKIISPDFNFLSVYHYFDLWFCAMFKGIPGLNPYCIYTCIVSPILFLAFVVGILAVLSYYKINPWLSLILALLLTATGRMFFSFYNNFLYLGSNYYPTTAFGEPPLVFPNKTLMLYPFTVAVCLLIKEKKNFTALLIVLYLAVIYSTIVPAIAGFFILLFVLNFYFKWVAHRDMFWLVSTGVVLMLFFYLFYHFQATGPQAYYNSFGVDILNTGYLKTRFHILIVTLMQLAVIYFPLVIAFLLLVFRNKLNSTNKFLLILSLFITISGLGAWVLFFKLDDSIQMFSNALPIVLTIITCVLAMLMGEYLSSNRFSVMKANGAGLTLLMLLLCYRWYASAEDGFSKKAYYQGLYSSGYVSEVLTKSSSLPLYSIGVYIKDKKDYYKIADKYSPSYTLSFFHCLSAHLLGSVNIGVFDMPRPGDETDSLRMSRMINQNVFYIFHQATLKNNPSQTVAQSQLQFVLKNKIKYAVCSRNASLPDTLMPLVKESPIIDSVSGEKFYLLNTPNP